MSERSYRCWAHSEGHTQDDSDLVHADTAKEAAKKFAERWFMREIANDPGDLEMVVATVRTDEAPPKVRAFSVVVEMELHSDATKVDLEDE